MVEEKKKAVEVPKEEPTVKNSDETKTDSKGSKQQESLKISDDPIKTEKEDDAEQKLEVSDATLILSAEDEAEIAAQTNEDVVKTEPTTPKTTQTVKLKRESHKNVWVSNINRLIKAADLKKLFSEKFKVESAKIVTNGKSLFGYICLESPEMAQKMVKNFNGASLAGQKLTLSLSRPDLPPKSSVGLDTKRSKEPRKEIRLSNGVKKSEAEVKKESVTSEEGRKGEGSETGKDAKQPRKEKEKEDADEEKLRLQRRQESSNRLIQELRSDFKRVSVELQNNRRRLSDATRDLEAERERKASMRRDIEELRAQLKSERRRFTDELEQLEKKRKVDENRYQEDRALLTRELNECRQLREFLQKKIDDIGMSSRRSRGSPHRSDRESDKGHRGRMDSRTARSTPPAPKLGRRSRSPQPYKGIKKPRVDNPPIKSMSYGNSHYHGQPSYSGGSKSLLGLYPQTGASGGAPLYVSTAYPDSHRYGSSSGYPPGSYMANPAPLMSRPMTYPDIRSSGGGPRKY